MFKKYPIINKILLIILILIILTLGAFVITSKIYLSPVDKNNEEVIKFVVEPGSSKNSIADKLAKSGLIKSALFFKFYIKLNQSKELYAGTYNLSKSMDVNEIIEVLNSNKSIENESITITFLEGKRLSDYAMDKEEVIKYLDSKEFIDDKIEKYWFLTDKVYNEKIYHPLEGYLFPDTYEFKKNATIDDIVNKLLKTMEQKLEVYKKEIDLSKFSVHELLTLASIVELESGGAEDRAGIAGVFYNRLNRNEPLGSDVTTYYGVNKDFSKDLSNNNLKSCNGYNTRAESSCPIYGLPVGPICSPSLASISAVIEPEKHDYYYFVADKNKKTYFSKTYSEHVKKVSSLKQVGLWYNY